MKVRIWFDVTTDGYVWIQKAESELVTSTIELQDPIENNKRYCVECEVSAPYEIKKVEGKLK